MVKQEEHADAAEEAAKPKKRRNIGSFPCSKCPKVFSRSDHLARHYLNHQPKHVYVCEYHVTDHGTRRQCGKTFVRRDLRERHVRRHEVERSKNPDDSGFSGAEQDQSPLDIANLIDDTAASSSSPPDSHPGLAPNAAAYPPVPVQPGPDLARASAHNTPPQLGRTDHGPALQAAGAVASPGPGYRTMQPMQQLSQAAQQNYPQSHLQGPPGHLPSSLSAPRHLHRQILSPPNDASHVLPSPHQGPRSSHPNSPGQFYNAPLRHDPPPFQGPKHSHISPHTHPLPMQPHPMYHRPTPAPRHFPEALRVQPFPQNAPNDALQHRGAMNPADLSKAGFNMPQSQGDIISWLFMDSPESSRSPLDKMPRSPHENLARSPGAASGVPELASGASSNGIYSQQGFPPQYPSYPKRDIHTSSNLFHNMGDSMLTIGLQDLNYFSNTDNPLDEVFLKSANNDFLNLADAPISGFPVYSALSSSPTNTNGSDTSGSEAKTCMSKQSVDDRLSHHSSMVNLEHNKHLFVDERVVKRLMASLPDLTEDKLRAIFQQDISKISHRLSLYLYAYWEVFHSRFSILHRPSFSTETAHPFLLLAMIIIGCNYCQSMDELSQNSTTSPEFSLAMLIAVPLRFRLFEHPEFKSPVNVWILQTLNLLEWSEKNFLMRSMHERAHIHHGTTVQLLHRSPFLGGNPAMTNKASGNNSENPSLSEDDHSDGVSDAEESINNDQALFRKWVESESMKRITFMTFYLDVIDYIKFRHNPQIPFFQLQLLNLPCNEDELWNSNEVNGSFKQVVKRQKKLQRGSAPGLRNMKDPLRIMPGMNFLSAMKRLMKSQRGQASQSKLSVFTMNILFGGVASVMHQMQQAELQNSFTAFLSPTDIRRTSVWKELILKVLDATEYDMRYSSCAQPLSNDSFFRDGTEQCRSPMYHLIQIIGVSDINHYDIAIFSGSPRNMSVEATAKDLGIVSRKLRTIWSSHNKSPDDSANMRCIIHCYWLLWSLMLSPLDVSNGAITDKQNFLSWGVEHDYYDSMYAVSVAVLVLWCHAFSICGTESELYESEKVEDRLDVPIDYKYLMSLSAEDGYQFLYRVRSEFTKMINDEGLTPDHLVHTTADNARRVPLTAALAKYCDKLPLVTKKENISGLCFLVGSKLLQSRWEILRENGKLLVNCGLRSIGKKAVQCPDVFSSELESCNDL